MVDKTWIAPDAAPFLPGSMDSLVQAEVFQCSEPLLVDDLSIERYESLFKEARAAGMRSFLCIPLGTSARHFGAISLWSRQAMEPDPELMPTIQAVATLLSQSLERRAAELEAMRAQAELEHAQALERAKTMFVNAVSHDLRTPLTAIIGYLELLEDNLGDGLGDMDRSYFQNIKASTAQLRRLVDDLLDHARLGAGTFRLERQEVDVRQVIEQVMQSLMPTADTRGVHLLLERAAQPLILQADPGRLEQVLANVVHNAIKFTPQGGRVQVRAIKAPTGIRIEVSDTGPGIPPEAREGIFRPFFQVRPERTRAYGGTGLGLSIAKAIVEAHGGRIGFESEAGGTTFWVFLPTAEESEEVRTSAPGGST